MAIIQELKLPERLWMIQLVSVHQAQYLMLMYQDTKSQWEETTTAVYSYNNEEYELFRGLENKFTGERVEVK